VIKKILIFQSLITALIALTAYFFASPQVAYGVVVGSFLVLFSLLVMQFIVFLLTQKKLIALSIPLIVIKYAILGIIVYFLISQSGLNIFGFSAGVGLILISAILAATFNNFEKT
jgi:hypothetical protein